MRFWCRLVVWHRWHVVRDTGKHQYRECARCKRRDVRVVNPYGYQPIDEQWLAGGDWYDLDSTEWQGLMLGSRSTKELERLWQQTFPANVPSE